MTAAIRSLVPREAREVDALLRGRVPRGLARADMTGPPTTRWVGELAADHFHPNDLGEAAIADVWLATLTGAGRAPVHPGGGPRGTGRTAAAPCGPDLQRTQ